MESVCDSGKRQFLTPWHQSTIPAALFDVVPTTLSWKPRKGLTTCDCPEYW